MDEQQTTTMQPPQKPSGRKPRVWAIILIVVLAGLIGFAGYALRNVYRYESAVSLLREAKYTEAAEAFEGLRDYRDAASYALYSRAAEAGEGGRYLAAANNLKAMNGFSDSSVLALYYEARADEEAELYELAQPLYAQISLYRDAEARLAALPGKILERDYQAARALEDAGQDRQAISAYRDLADYQDSAARADALVARLQEQANADAYAQAEAALSEGRPAEARDAFQALGEYRDSAARAEEAQQQLNAQAYAAADAAARRNDAITAYEGFLALADYRDSSARAEALRNERGYQTAWKQVKAGQFAQAYAGFLALGEYRDSAEKAQALWISQSAKMTTLGDGLAAYRLGDKMGLVNLNTNRVTVAGFDSIDSFQAVNGTDGLARVSVGGLYGFIDTAGQTRIPAIYTEVGSFNRLGLCRVRAQQGGYGYINTENSEVIPCQYAALSAFSGKVCAARVNGRMGLLDAQGNALTAATYRQMGTVLASDSPLSVPEFDSQGLMRVRTDDGSYALMNREYQQLGDTTWDAISDFSEGLARVKSGAYYGFIDTNGDIVIAPEWPYADAFSGGRCAVRAASGKYGYIDAAGELVIPAVYADRTAFADGHAAVYMPAVGWFEIDAQGKNVGFAVVPYERAMSAMEAGDYEAAAEGFRSLGEYGDAYDRMLEAYYRQALALRDEGQLSEAGRIAMSLSGQGYLDSEALYTAIQADQLFESGALAEAWTLYAQVDEKLRRHQDTYAERYAAAEELLQNEAYDDALAAFQALGAYADSETRVEEAYDGKYQTEYTAAMALMEQEAYDEAIAGFSALGEYSRAQDMAQECRYLKALKTEQDGSREMARAQMAALGDYRDAEAQTLRMDADMLFESGRTADAWAIYQTLAADYRDHRDDYVRLYEAAQAQLDNGRFDEAEAGFAALGGYEDSEAKIEACREGRRDAAYQAAKALLDGGQYDEAKAAFTALGDYRDSADMVSEATYRQALGYADAHDWNSASLGLFSLVEDGQETVSRLSGQSVDAQCQAILALSGYRDAAAQLVRVAAEHQFEEGRYDVAWEIFSHLDVEYHTQDGAFAALYEAAAAQLEDGQFEEAEAGFTALGGYQDSAARAEACREGRRNADYQAAVELLEKGDYNDAAAAFTALGGYCDSADMVREAAYRQGLALDQENQREEAFAKLLTLLDDDDKAVSLNDRSAVTWLQTAKGYKDTPAQLCRLIADNAFDSGDTAAAWAMYAGLDADYHTHDEDYQAMYAAAEALLDDKQYADAQAAFQALGGYRDSAQRADGALLAGKEDTYQQAVALQADGLYDEAYDLYASLKDYSDSADKLLEVAQQKAEHLYAEGRYAEAAEVYRLLGSDKALDADWHEAERLRDAGEYMAASAKWLGIADYADSRAQNYAMASALEEAGDSQTALAIFASDMDYEDARERIYAIGTKAHDAEAYQTAVAAWTALGAYKDSGMNLTMDTYAYGGQLFDSGRYDEAAAVFTGMNGFSNTAERAQESAYQAAKAALEAGEYDDAAQRFTALGGYQDSQVMVTEARYRAAAADLAAGEYERALQAFKGMRNYKDSATNAQAAQYAIADRAYQAGEYRAAISGFDLIRDYRDAENRWRQARYMLYGEALKAEQYDEAISGFETLAAEGYSAAVSEAGRSHYLKAKALDQQEKTEEAYAEYVQAGQYEDAPAQAKARAYALAEGLRAQADYPAAVTWYEIADDHADAREQLYKIGEYYFSVQDWPNAINAYKTLAGQWDASDKLCRIGQYYEMQSDRLNACLAYGYAGPDSEGAEKAAALMQALTAEADQLVASGKMADGIRLYETLVRINPELYPSLITADMVHFIAQKGRTLRIGNTDWQYLYTHTDGGMVFISSYVLGNESYNNVSSWLSNAKQRYFSAAEQAQVSGLWVMSKTDIEKYLPSASARKTSGTSQIWTSTQDNSYYSKYYFTYSASSGSMSSTRASNSGGMRPALKLRPGIVKLIAGDPAHYAFYEGGKAIAYTSDYQTAYDAAIDAERLKRYRRALALLERGDYADASDIFADLGDYQESARMVQECAYQQALALAAAGENEAAIAAFTALNGYSDSAGQIALARERLRAERYTLAERLAGEEKYAEAYDLFADEDMAGYQDSAARAAQMAEKAEEQKRGQRYDKATALYAAGSLDEAAADFEALGDYRDSAAQLRTVREAIRARDYALAVEAMNERRLGEAATLFESVGDYEDSQARLANIDILYQAALSQALAGNLTPAYEGFTALGTYQDSAQKAEIVGNLSRAGKMEKLDEGVLIYEFHDLWGIANLKTNVITPVKYTGITFDRGSRYAGYGLARVYISGGSRRSSSNDIIHANDTYGYIDMNGREVVPCQYLLLTDFDGQGRCTVGQHTKDERDYRVVYGIMTSDGNTLTKAQWRTMGTCVNKDWNDWDSIDYWRTNKFTVTLPEFSDGRMKVQNADGLWGYISEQGRVLGTVKWTSVGAFADGLAMVSERVNIGSRYSSNYVTRYGFIDGNGQTVGEVRWDTVMDFSQGLAAVRENGMWGFIDRTNTLVIPCQYMEVNAFKPDGTCDVRNSDGTWIVIDREGKNAFF